MIQANELRIGNWVLNAYPNPVQVDGESLMIMENHQTDISPIPLTHEILENCWFKKRHSYVSYYYDGNDYMISIKGETFSFYDSNADDPLVQIMYVHQLQNLYFALTGTELEIKL